MVEGIATVLTLRFSSTLEMIGLGEGVRGNFLPMICSYSVDR